MNKIYILLIIVMFALGLGAFLLPERQYTEELSPKELFLAMNNPSRWVSTDQVARKIIEAEPSILLVDTRSYDEYEAFSLPGALNIPLFDMVDTNGVIYPEWIDYLDITGMKIVFFSNSDITADQAWVICTRQGLDELYVMKGGLNYWVETILRPQKPSSTAPTEEFALYDFRRGAARYFGGGSIVIETDASAEPVTVVRKKKKNIASGGC